MIRENREKWAKIREESHQLAADTVDKVLMLNQQLKEYTKNRLMTMCEDVKSNQLKLIELWKSREKYRLNIMQRNESLRYLLNRAKEAINKVRDCVTFCIIS
jgi:hypothetical protein